MTDNTQDIDEILDIHDNLVLLRKAAGDDTDELRETTKQAIIDWHNKQVEAVLDRLEGENIGLCMADGQDVELFLEAERNKLKESSDGD